MVKFLVAITGISRESPLLNGIILDKVEIERIQKGYLKSRLADICIGLQSLELSALELSEIVIESIKFCENIPFHIIWEMIISIKHFK